MKEYIEKDTAIKWVRDIPDTMSASTSIDMCLGMKSMKSRALSALSDVPAADVVEVRHGRWVNIVHAIVDTTGYCDKCHSQSVWRTRDMAYEICPRCGAKMDGGVNDG